MAIRNIFVEGDPILRKNCRPVVKFDEKLHTLLDDMHDTLSKSDGVGLAAPQVGICRRIFIIHLDGEEFIEAINPEISDESGKQYVVEGCLSCPDVWGKVTRPTKITLKALDRNGEPFEMDMFDLAAQCACHENAHLDGQLFTDIAEEFIDPDDMDEETKRQRKKKTRTLIVRKDISK
ncbi:MAG: peptide deformylase [Ruminococcus sp.]|nr:peptide deformylase [Ruminococcus sp.]